MAILLPYVPCRFSYIRPPTLSLAFKGSGLERRRVCLIGNRDWTVRPKRAEPNMLPARAPPH